MSVASVNHIFICINDEDGLPSKGLIYNCHAASAPCFCNSQGVVPVLPDNGSIQLPGNTSMITLKLYGYYKQAMCGICNQKKPFSRLQIRRQAMFQSWKACGSMSAEEAKQRYVRTVKESFGKQYDKYMENEND